MILAERDARAAANYSAGHLIALTRRCVSVAADHTEHSNSDSKCRTPPRYDARAPSERRPSGRVRGASLRGARPRSHFAWWTRWRELRGRRSLPPGARAGPAEVSRAATAQGPLGPQPPPPPAGGIFHADGAIRADCARASRYRVITDTQQEGQTDAMNQPATIPPPTQTSSSAFVLALHNKSKRGAIKLPRRVYYADSASRYCIGLVYR